MAQFFGNEILKAITLAGSLVTLPSGCHLKIKGQGYTNLANKTLAVSGLSGMAIYFIYAFQSGDSFELVSQLTPPSQNTDKKLVGAFYTDSVGILSTSNIAVRPNTEWKTSSFVGTSWDDHANVTKLERSFIDGDNLNVYLQLDMTGTVTGQGTCYINFHTGLLANVSDKFTNGTDINIIGEGNYYDTGSANYEVKVSLSAGSSGKVVRVYDNTVNMNRTDWTDTSPIVPTTTDQLIVQFRFPVVGWSNTPLKDL